METKSRVTKSIKNTGFGLIGMAISLIAQFISRTFFIRLLGAEYNGINGLFSNILQVLNLAELGFAYSVAYALYAPLQSENREKICAIMNFLRRVYNVITIVVLMLGLICLPLLQFLIKDDISTLVFSIEEIRGFFAVYLLNTALSYVFSYKRTIITADQKSYLVSNVDNLSNVILYCVQIVALLVWQNYYLYLALMSAKTILGNVIITVIANRKYPYLKQNKRSTLDKNERKAILKNVGAMFFHRIGGVTIYSTTTIIISAFVGIMDTNKYVNYVLIVNAVRTMVDLVFSALTASVGNLCETAEKDYQYRVFRRVSYFSSFCSVFACICLFGLLNSFIPIWVGEDMVFDLPVVAIISLSAMIAIYRLAVGTFKNAKGLFKEDCFKPLVEAGFGIALAIGLSYVWGTMGVILGYTLASLLVALPVETFVLFKKGFGIGGQKLVLQFVRLLGCFALSVAGGALALYVCSLLGNGLMWFVVKAIICMAISTVLFVLTTFKMDAFRYYVSLAGRLLGKIFKRKNSEEEVKQNSEE